MNRKSQVSAFIILGIIVLLGAVTFFYVKTTFRAPPGTQGPDILKIPGDETSLKEYVQSCIYQKTQPLLPELAQNGGKLVLNEDDYIWYNKDRYRIFCNHVEGYRSCQNSYITRQDIEKQLESVLPSLMDECLDFSSFTERGIGIDASDMVFDVKLGKYGLKVELNYPIIMTINGKKVHVEDYFVEIPSNIGFMYDLVISIVNDEVNKGFFDQDNWMVDNNVFIRVEKHRPYPNIVYSLQRDDPKIRENLDFRFSLQGEDTSVKVGSAPSMEKIGKDCINQYDMMCFKNVDTDFCQRNDGQVTICNSEYPESNLQDCEGSGCSDCSDISHGTSWCEYDSVQKLASYGLSYVGSRHYKKSCIDGEVIREECRDYREELCTQQDDKALCRVNRWDDCGFCTTETCCIDETKRDCQWDSSLLSNMDDSRVRLQYDSKKCFPKVPPGFRFWDGFGSDVCSLATQYAYCKGWGACPRDFVDDTALYCIRLGDCGNFRNIADRLTLTGYFNTDPSDIPADYIYLENNLNRDPVSELGFDPPLTVDLYSTNQNLLVPEYTTTLEILPVLMEQTVSYLDYVQSISLNPFSLIDLDPWVLEYSFCSLWIPPEGSSDCRFCSSDPEKPCSEYRCKSLGKNCKFELEQGVGVCTAFNSDDHDPPNIIFNDASLQDGFSASPDHITAADKRIDGYGITPAVMPYFPFSFGINTDEPARCKLAYLPIFDYYSLPAIWFGDPKFNLNHTIFLRFPKELSVPSKVYKYLDIKSLSEIVDMISNLEDTYENYKDKYRLEIEIFESIKGIDVTEIGDRVVKLILRTVQPFIDMFPYLKDLAKVILENFENNGYFLFVKCVDEAGNQNTHPFYIKFQIDVDAVDSYPVVFIESDPENNSEIASEASMIDILYYINEPAECRFDFIDKPYSQLQYSFDCPSDQMSYSGVGYGSYKCTGSIPFEDDGAGIFVKCLDNPINIEEYSLNFLLADNLSHPRYSAPYFEAVDNNVFIDADLLKRDEFMYYDAASLNFNLYFDEDKVCRYSFVNLSFEDSTSLFSDCDVSDANHAGLFICPTSMLIPHHNSTAYIKCRDKVLPDRNVNHDSVVLRFNRSKELEDVLSITGSNIRVGDALYMSGDDVPSSSPYLAVVMSKEISENDIRCGYYEDRVHGLTAMYPIDEYIFEVQLENLDIGFHNFFIECYDSLQNRIINEVEFFVA
ncbi:MAG: hypothetical protein V1740_06040 [Candidatus Woesearchaeota archaeon]